ncbi:MAG: hypothetical protein ABSE62_12345 [Chthoniobacteraceae bacterium]|jgi:hypothetical protein
MPKVKKHTHEMTDKELLSEVFHPKVIAHAKKIAHAARKKPK